jgi:RNA ligase
MTQRPLLSSLFDLDLLESEVAAGYVTRRLHPTAPLAILNYGPTVQYERRWNEVTTKTRGLIYNTESLAIESRAFDKFFNWDDSSVQYPPKGAMVMSTKFDGSLGILYEVGHVLQVATRGSFESDQAKHATERLYWDLYADAEEYWVAYDTSLSQDLHRLLEANKTPVFEIIYPENRIVVDYGKDDKLVLLDVIDNETGKSDLTAFDELRWPHKAEKTLVPGGFSDTLTHDIPSGEEGFVLYFPHTGFRTKMKSAEYVELHRIVTGLSKKTVWEMMGDGKSIEQIKENIPDELYDWVDETARDLRFQQWKIMDEIGEAWHEIVSKSPKYGDVAAMTRKQFAEAAKKQGPLASYLFAILDGKTEEEIADKVWATLKPVGDTRVFKQSEDTA